jgi:hypothetical protein
MPCSGCSIHPSLASLSQTAGFSPDSRDSAQTPSSRLFPPAKPGEVAGRPMTRPLSRTQAFIDFDRATETSLRPAPLPFLLRSPIPPTVYSAPALLHETSLPRSISPANTNLPVPSSFPSSPSHFAIAPSPPAFPQSRPRSTTSPPASSPFPHAPRPLHHLTTSSTISRPFFLPRPPSSPKILASLRHTFFSYFFSPLHSFNPPFPPSPPFSTNYPHSLTHSPPVFLLPLLSIIIKAYQHVPLVSHRQRPTPFLQPNHRSFSPFLASQLYCQHVTFTAKPTSILTSSIIAIQCRDPIIPFWIYGSSDTGSWGLSHVFCLAISLDVELPIYFSQQATTFG